MKRGVFVTAMAVAGFALIMGACSMGEETFSGISGTTIDRLHEENMGGNSF